MATNKNAIIRYNALDKCFSNFGKKYYFEDLLDAINNALSDFDASSTGIKIRQLRDDIRFMRSEAGYSAPIKAFQEDGKKAYYRYEEKDFSINKSPLNVTEIGQLKSALTILQRFEGAPQFEWISEITTMFEDKFELKKSDKKIISYDENIDYSGYNNISPLFNAVLNKQTLKIRYKPFDKHEFTLIFHPYFLKQYNKRWFVFGYNQELKISTWNMALDRILEIKESDEKYISTNIDWEDYFYDVIGVTIPQNKKIEEIELLFSEEQSSYIQTKPLHPSQKSYLLESGMLKVKLKLIPNYELELLLLSFADKVKVISPKSLKNKIAERLKKGYLHY
ncbi:MAG: WYL domain-containing protein [Bacteroidetes bacterium]|nr:MAG: WYL domain-containing protein [Bacteroidota bacterium]